MTYTGKILITTATSKKGFPIGRIAVYRELKAESYLFLYEERAKVKRLTHKDAITDAEMLALDYIDQNPSVKLKMVREKS